MAFISITDLQKGLQLELINEISREDASVIDHVISAAIAEAKTYLRVNYNVESIFSQTGTSRDALLVTFVSDIAIYNLIELVQPGIDLEDRRARYKRAIDWLKQVKSQEIKPDLPVASTSLAADDINYGSAERRENRY